MFDYEHYVGDLAKIMVNGAPRPYVAFQIPRPLLVCLYNPRKTASHDSTLAVWHRGRFLPAANGVRPFHHITTKDKGENDEIKI